MSDLASTALARVEPPQIEPVAAPKLCSTEGCGRTRVAKGLCGRCYYRHRRAERASTIELELSTDGASVSYSTRASGAERFPEYPYPEITDADPRADEKRIANSIVDLLWSKRDVEYENREEMNKMLQMWKERAEAPEGFYPASWYFDANPVRKLTKEEKLTCIRLLPPEISEKLFPNI